MPKNGFLPEGRRVVRPAQADDDKGVDIGDLKRSLVQHGANNLPDDYHVLDDQGYVSINGNGR